MSVTSQLTKDDKRILFFVALVWGVDMLYYLKAIVMRLPVVNLLADYFVPLVVIASMLIAFRSLYKRFIMADYAFYTICVIAYVVTYVLFPNNATYLDQFMPLVFFQMLPYFFVGLLVEPPKQIKVIEYVSMAYIVLSLVYLTATFATRDVGGEEMGLAYSMLPHLLVLLYAVIRKFHWYTLTIFLLGLFRLLGTGNRGSLLCIAFFLFLYLLIAGRFRHKWFVVTIVSAAVLVIWWRQDVVFGYLNDTLAGLGFNTRVFNMMSEGKLSDANGRDVLFSFFKGKIETGGLFGYGILGDRALMNMENGYPHNLAVELWVDFGIFLGSALLLVLLYLFVKAYLCASNQDSKAYLALFFTVGVFSLFLSNSYLSNPMFFMAIGYAVRTIRDSRTNNYHTSQLHHANENPISKYKHRLRRSN